MHSGDLYHACSRRCVSLLEGLKLGTEGPSSAPPAAVPLTALNYFPTIRIFNNQNPQHDIHNYNDTFLHLPDEQLQVTMSTAELATSYAALILADDGVDITVRSFLVLPKVLLLIAVRPTNSTH
jgi:hypothetical protein